MKVASILAAGLVCAAGSDRAQASAAFAAGERFLQQDRSLVGPDGFAVTTACVTPLQEERDYYSRIYTLFEDAFVQCQRELAAIRDDRRLPLTLLLPSVIRLPEAEDWFRTEIMDRLGSKVSEVSILFGGAADGLELLAQETLDARYVAAVDSAIAADVIDRLILQGRLYSACNPWGVFPGEGAAVLAIGMASNALADVIRLSRMVESVRPDDPGRGIIGRALAAAMRQVSADGPAPLRLMADLDGSRSATEELGFAVTAAAQFVTPLADRVHSLMPQIGYTGAASGLILAALACDGDIPALICASDPAGARCCALIDRASGASG